MPVFDSMLIAPSLSLILGTIGGVALFALIGWIVLGVIPRYLNHYARRIGSRL